MNPRRRFIAIAPWYALAGSALLAACSPPASPPGSAADPAPTPAPAAATPPVDTAATPAAAGSMVNPAEPQAVALGYVALSSQVDKARYPMHADSQNCAGCALYSGAAGASAGPCSIFAGRQVSAPGWCSAWSKKA